MNRSRLFPTFGLVWFLVQSIIDCHQISFDSASVSIKCGTGKVLQNTTLECVSCDTSSQTVSTFQNCICKSGYVLQKNVAALSVSYSCQACPANTVSSSDSSFCVGCIGGAATGNSSTASCSTCSSGTVQLDRDIVGDPLSSVQCASCPTFAYPAADGKSCIRCPETIMKAVLTDGKYSCTCPTPLYNAAPANGSCIPADIFTKINLDYPPSKIGIITYSNLVSSTSVGSNSYKSDVISNMFLRVAAKCNYEMDSESCQALANMCVLQDYDDATDGSSCKMYVTMARDRGSIDSDHPDWPKNMPWLYYGLLKLEDATTSMSKAVGLSFSTYPSISANKITFILAKYTFSGSFVKFETLTDQLQFCPLESVKKSSFLRIGQSLTNSCKVNLKYLLDSPVVNFFYDLYILNGAGTLIPVPIKRINIRNGGDVKNTQIGSSSYADVRLTRRFFLMETVASQTSSGGASSVVRIADYILLRIPLEGLSGTNAQVNMPLLEIRYTERLLSSLSEDDTSSISAVPISFMAKYETNNDKFWSDVSTTLIVFSIFAGLSWAYLCNVWSRKAQDSGEALTVTAMASWIVIAAKMTCWLMFIIMFFTCLVRFIGFKSQDDVLSIIPSDAYSFKMFDSGLTVMIICSGIYCAFTLYRQCDCIVFFMDWEKPKGKLQSVSNDEKEILSPVSIWRTIFSVKEWSRLQTYRRISIPTILILMILFMKGLNLRNLAMPSPTMDLDVYGVPNRILLFSINSIVWVGISFIIILWKTILYERFYVHKLYQFVDSLSMANISMFILDYKYHGYYVHGRSVHPFADTNMSEMSGNLKKEESGLVAKRGLNSSDQQTFELFITKGFRSIYDKIYTLLVDTNRNVLTNVGRNNEKTSHGFAKSIDENIIKTYDAINKLLCRYVDNNLKENGYIVRKPTFEEKYLGSVPELLKVSYFLNDNGRAFGNVLVKALEYELLIFYLALYNIVDINNDQPYLAVFVVFIVDLALMWLRMHYGRKNIAYRTLVDERFLF